MPVVLLSPARKSTHGNTSCVVPRRLRGGVGKRGATKPAAANVLQQQARFDDFITRYNTDRPHQALGMKGPADLYARSSRVYRGLEDVTYPFHDHAILVTGCGRICLPRPQGE